jgi:phage-related protein
LDRDAMSYESMMPQANGGSYIRSTLTRFVIAGVFAKKTAKTPKAVLETCRRRLKEYNHAGN